MLTNKWVSVLANSPSSGSRIDISVDEPFRAEVTEDWLRTVMEKALQVALEPQQGRSQVGLFLTGDATIRELNANYRGLNEVTDVLSFSTTHPGHWEGDDAPDGSREPEEDPLQPFVLPPNELFPLGEVVVSYPQACQQARMFNRSISQELALLIVHGVLHLVGYDHLEAEEQAVMQAKERAALEEIFPRGLD